MKFLVIYYDGNNDQARIMENDPRDVESSGSMSFANHLWGLPDDYNIIAIVAQGNDVDGVVDWDSDIHNVYINELLCGDEVLLASPTPPDEAQVESGTSDEQAGGDAEAPTTESPTE